MATDEDARGPWPLVGRDAELQVVADALTRGGSVLLAGPAGVGKSRLAREALGRTVPDAPWLAGSESAREMPLGAFASLLGTAAGAGTDPDALQRAAAALRGSGPHPVLAVDDAHQFDPISATLLHQLGCAGDVRLLLTVRTGVAAPDAVTALWKDGLVERLDVAPLAEPDTAALLTAALGGAVDAATHSRLFAATRGNVLWLRHLVDGELAAGRLSRHGGEWHWTGEPTLSPALSDLVDARVGRLSEPARRLLELLAFGEPLGVELLSALVGADTVEDAAERGLVTVTTSGRRWDVRLGHPLYGEVARGRIDPLRARRRRRELVEALQAPGARRFGDELRCTVLALDGGLQVEPDRLTAAGAEAAALTDPVLAERLFRAALASGGGFEPQIALGYLLSWSMRPEADGELSRAVERAATGPEWGRAVLMRLTHLYFVAARPADALAELREAERAAAPGPAREDLRAARCMFAAAADRIDEAVETGHRVLAAPEASAQALTWVGYALVTAYGLTGRADLLDAAARSAIAAARSAPDVAVMPFNISYMHLAGLGLAGRVQQAEDMQAGPPDGAGPAAVMTRTAYAARTALDAGRVVTAAQGFRDLRASFPGHGGGWTAVFESGLAQALGMAGDAEGAAEALARADEFRHPGVTVFEPDRMLAGAWVAAAEGAVTVATERALQAAERAAGSAQWAMEVVARHTAVRFGDDGQVARLAELAGRVDGPRAPAAAAHAAAWSARDPHALLAVSDRLESCDLLLPAADAAAQAAALHRGADRFDQAVLATTRCGELARRCDAARTPALTLAGSRLPISAQEREVATLVGIGLSDREIADRMRVPVWTVEGDLHRACTRLGVADRTALAALVRDRYGAAGS